MKWNHWQIPTEWDHVTHMLHPIQFDIQAFTNPTKGMGNWNSFQRRVQKVAHAPDAGMNFNLPVNTMIFQFTSDYYNDIPIYQWHIYLNLPAVTLHWYKKFQFTWQWYFNLPAVHCCKRFLFTTMIFQFTGGAMLQEISIYQCTIMFQLIGWFQFTNERNGTL